MSPEARAFEHRSDGRLPAPAPMSTGWVRRLVILVSVVATLFLLRYAATLSPRLRPVSRHGIDGLARYVAGDYGGAAAAYRADLEAASADVPLDLDDDELAFLQGHADRARELASRTLARTPDATGPLLTLAEIALDAGATDEAVRRTTQALDRAPADTDALVLAAVARARAGDDAAAIVALDRALGEWDGERRAMTLVHVLGETGRLYALDSSRRSNCLLALLHRYLRIHDDTQGWRAITRAREAIANGEHADEAWVTIGVVHQKHAEDDEALDAFQHAIEVNARNAEALRWASIIHADRGDLANQYRMARAAYEAAPQQPLYAVSFAHVLADRLGDYTTAVEIETAVLAAGHESATLVAHLAYLDAMLGRFPEAIRNYERALVLDPTNPRLYSAFGWTLCRADRFDEGTASLRRALAMAPGFTSARLSLAIAYRNSGRYDAAIPEFERVYREDPTQRAYMPDLCIAYHLAGRFDRARACTNEFVQYVGGGPQSAEIQFLRSFSLEDAFAGRERR